MSGSGLQVKAILLREGVEEGMKEVRRFRMEEARGSQRLQHLLTLVRSVFNVDAATQQCSLYWKDDDGDLVQFSTEEEFSHALDTGCDDTFRLYVILSEEDTEDTNQPEGSDEDQVSGRQVMFDVAYDRLCTDPDSITRLPCPGMVCGPMGRKGRKMACKMAKTMDKGKNKEFHQVRQQVPEEFRGFVRQYVRTWHTQGPEAAQKWTSEQTLPEGVPPDFPQWLHAFLTRHASSPDPGHAPATGDKEMEVERAEGGEGEGPEGLPPMYFRWLTLFLPRFRARYSRMEAGGGELEGEKSHCFCREGQQKKHHKGLGKHGCRGKRGDKHGTQCASSESEESDGEQKAWKQVPKEFRKYARVTIKQLHKNTGNNTDNREKATQAGLSSDVQEFVEQILLEWHIKLSSQRPRAVAMEMMGGERTLPAGLEWNHFLWLCRFLSRWHRRHAEKCDVMSGWSSGETTSDDTSGEESAPQGGIADYGPWPRQHRREFRTAMRMMTGHPSGMMGPPPRCYSLQHGRPYGMMGHPPPPFAMLAGTDCDRCPLPHHLGPRKCGAERCGWMDRGMRKGGCCFKRGKRQDGAGQGEASGVQDDAVRHVEEGVKKL